MPDLRDERELDLLLRRHFSRELDGQLGRAGSRFRQYLNEAQDSPAPARGRGGWNRRGPWVFGMIGSAMAASIAAVFAGPALWSGGTASRPGAQGPGELPAVRVDHTVRSRYFDGGTFYTEDGTPVRRIRRVNRHEMQWLDERSGEKGQRVVPSEDVMLYELKTY